MESWHEKKLLDLPEGFEVGISSDDKFRRMCKFLHRLKKQGFMCQTGSYKFIRTGKNKTEWKGYIKKKNRK